MSKSDEKGDKPDRSDREALAVEEILGKTLCDRADDFKQGRRVLRPHTGGTIELAEGDYAVVVSEKGVVTQHTPSNRDDLPLIQLAGMMSISAVCTQMAEDMLILACLDEFEKETGVSDGEGDN